MEKCASTILSVIVVKTKSAVINHQWLNLVKVSHFQLCTFLFMFVLMYFLLLGEFVLNHLRRHIIDDILTNSAAES